MRADGPKRATIWTSGRGIATSELSLAHSFTESAAIADAADTAALKRRVMEILERHGRELHQVLAREIVRQQRREFNPLLSNQ